MGSHYTNECKACGAAEGYSCHQDCVRRLKAEKEGGGYKSWQAINPTGTNYDTSPVEALKQQVGGDHYKSLTIQPIEYITKNNLGWCEGNVVKYISRWKQKGQHADLDKVIHYVNLLKELNG